MNHIWLHWNERIIGGAIKVTCKYCNGHTQLKNATKCRRHTLNCKNASDKVKRSIDASQGGGEKRPFDRIEDAEDEAGVLQWSSDLSQTPAGYRKQASKRRKQMISDSESESSLNNLNTSLNAGQNGSRKRSFDEGSIAEDELTDVFQQVESLLQPSEDLLVVDVDGQPLIENFITKLNMDKVNEAIVLFAKYLITTDASFKSVENYFLKKFFALLHLSHFLPTRRQLSGLILDRLYAEAKKCLEKIINSSDHLALVVDIWDNCNNLGVLNIMISNPESTFYKSIEIVGQSITHQVLKEEIETVIEEIGLSKITAIISDNGSNMILTQQQMNLKYNTILRINCAAHTLNLLIQDMTKLMGPHLLILNAKEIVKEIVKSRTKKGQFIKKWDEHVKKEKEKGNFVRKINLLTPVMTRWYAISDMIYRLMRNKEVLKNLAIDPEVHIKDENQKMILSNDFWKDLKEFYNFINPMIKGLDIIQSEDAVISDVVHIFLNFEKQVFTSEKMSFLNVPQQVQAKKCYERRISRDFITIYHYIVYLLDPNYKGDLIKGNAHLEIEMMNVLEKYARDLGLITSEQDQFEISTSLAEFRDGQGLFSIGLYKDKNPARFWKKFKIHESTKRLAEIGARLLSIGASSAGVERSFSRQKRIHNNDRNRLIHDKVQKLMTVRGYLNDEIKKKDNKIVKPTLTQTSNQSPDEEIDDDLNCVLPYDIDDIIYLDQPGNEIEMS